MVSNPKTITTFRTLDSWFSEWADKNMVDDENDRANVFTIVEDQHCKTPFYSKYDLFKAFDAVYETL